MDFETVDPKIFSGTEVCGGFVEASKVFWLISLENSMIKSQAFAMSLVKGIWGECLIILCVSLLALIHEMIVTITHSSISGYQPQPGHPALWEM